MAWSTFLPWGNLSKSSKNFNIIFILVNISLTTWFTTGFSCTFMHLHQPFHAKNYVIAHLVLNLKIHYCFNSLYHHYGLEHLFINVTISSLGSKMILTFIFICCIFTLSTIYYNKIFWKFLGLIKIMVGSLPIWKTNLTTFGLQCIWPH